MDTSVAQGDVKVSIVAGTLHDVLPSQPSFSFSITLLLSAMQLVLELERPDTFIISKRFILFQVLQ